MSRSKVLSTYSTEVLRNITNMKIQNQSDQKLNYIIERVLPKRMSHMSFIIRNLNLKISLVDVGTATTTNIVTISIDFENKSWYRQLCVNHNVSCFYIVGPNGKQLIDTLKRQDFMLGFVCYGALEKSITQWKDHLPKIAAPMFQTENRHSRVKDIICNAFKLITIMIVNKLKEMNKDQFKQFVTSSTTNTVLSKIISETFRTVEIYEDGSTKSIVEFNTRYLNSTSKEDIMNLESFFVSYVIHTTRFLLYFAKIRFLNYIHSIHECHARKHLNPMMSIVEFESFWKIQLEDMFSRILDQFSNNTLIKALKSTSSHNVERIISICLSSLIEEKHVPSDLYEYDDDYKSYYDGIQVPIHYGWMSGNKKIPATKILLNTLENNGTLLINGKRKQNLQKKSKPFIYFKRGGVDMEYPITPHNVSLKIFESEPVLYLEHESQDPKKSIMVGTVSHNWWTHDGSWKKASSLMEENVDKEKHYFSEK